MYIILRWNSRNWETLLAKIERNPIRATVKYGGAEFVLNSAHRQRQMFPCSRENITRLCLQWSVCTRVVNEPSRSYSAGRRPQPRIFVDKCPALMSMPYLHKNMSPICVRAYHEFGKQRRYKYSFRKIAWEAYSVHTYPLEFL